MKICPHCQSKYTDDTLRFCLQDGQELNEVNDEKTLVLDADSFADELTITDKVDRRETDKIPSAGKTEVVNELDQSVETVIHPRAEVDSAGVTLGGGSFGFVSGFLLAVLVLGVLGLGVFAVLTFWPDRELAGNSNTNSNSVENETRILTDSNEVKVSSSSTRKPEKGNLYDPKLAFDGNPRTAWSEGARGAGLGQWVAFNFRKEETIKEVIIQPGYFKTEELWKKNNRVSSAVLEFSDGSKKMVQFDDEMKDKSISLQNKKTKSVLIRIKSVYPGASDSKDTLISEVSFVVE